MSDKQENARCLSYMKNNLGEQVMVKRSTLVIGTRGSPLALAQAHEVQERLSDKLGWEKDRLPLQVIKTSGDLIQDRSLTDAGGKGLFTRELDIALIDQNIDLAVHSAKDLPSCFPDGIRFGGCLPREDVRDAFISLKYKSLEDLPQNAVIGSASLRRQALLTMKRPDLKVTLLRGNVETRLRKLQEGLFDGTLLAVAGLKRLGFMHHATQILETDQFLPAVGQGAIALSLRTDDLWLEKQLEQIIEPLTTAAVQMERAFLEVLDGSCRMPIAGYARLVDNRFHFTGQILRPDGSECLSSERICLLEDAVKTGRDAGLELKKRMPADFLG